MRRWCTELNSHREGPNLQHAHATHAGNGTASHGVAAGNEFVERQIVVREVDLREEGPTRDKLLQEDKRRRETVPRESHADWSAPRNRPDPVATVLASNKGRRQELIPLRMGRMAASPFTFLRGAAAVMAWDLAKTPNISHSVVIDGDAHLNNFGFCGTPQRDLMMDLNDFDEATYDPWEWDLKRLVVSVNFAVRENGMNRRDRRASVMRCVEG